LIKAIQIVNDYLYINIVILPSWKYILIVNDYLIRV
jgi:hypothetical protein